MAIRTTSRFASASPSAPHITVDPELAVLNILDVAANMTIALLMIFHPAIDDPETHRDRGHYLANRIIADAHHLRHALADYQHHIDLDLPDTSFPF